MPRPMIGSTQLCQWCGKDFKIEKRIFFVDVGYTCCKYCFDKYVESQVLFNKERINLGR